MLVLRSRLRFDLEDFADARERAGELAEVENVVTVDAGDGVSPLVFFLDSDFGRFDDGDTEDDVRLLGEVIFNSLLEDLLLFTTISDDRCFSSRLDDEDLRRADDPLFEDERLRVAGEGRAPLDELLADAERRLS